MQQLLGGPRAGLSAAEVNYALSLETPRYRCGVDVLDVAGDNPIANTLRVEGSEVQWASRVREQQSGSPEVQAEVRRTASMTAVTDLGFNVYAATFRPWMELQTFTGGWVRFNQGLFLHVGAPPHDYDGIVNRRSLDLADATHRYASTELDDYVAVPFNRNPILFVREILEARFQQTRFAFPATNAATTDDLVFEPGTSYLQMFNTVLEHCGLDALIVDEEGRNTTRLSVDPADRPLEHTYQPGGTLLAAGQLAAVTPEIPNVVRFQPTNPPTLLEEGNGQATRKNQSTGPACIDERGFEISKIVEVDAEDQPALERIADRDKNFHFAGGGVRYVGQVGLNPRHGDSDIVGLYKPSMGLGSTAAALKCQVVSWALPMRAPSGDGDVLMPIEAEQVVL